MLIQSSETLSLSLPFAIKTTFSPHHDDSYTCEADAYVMSESRRMARAAHTPCLRWDMGTERMCIQVAVEDVQPRTRGFNPLVSAFNGVVCGDHGRHTPSEVVPRLSSSSVRESAPGLLRRRYNIAIPCTFSVIREMTSYGRKRPVDHARGDDDVADVRTWAGLRYDDDRLLHSVLLIAALRSDKEVAMSGGNAVGRRCVWNRRLDTLCDVRRQPFARNFSVCSRHIYASAGTDVDR
ncbi:hypothetical protein C8Q74DRAFT_1236531 [Fomes fomentarius]|nr:hypothetical protein C8Q74DRAFT_1236531 [Fomes fomentarius]